MKNIMLALISAILVCGPVRADLSDLIELAKNQGEIQKDNQQETASYNLVKAAFDRGALTKGRTKADIAGQFGEPVVMLQDKYKNQGLEKWIYKRSSESYFGGEQLYIFFDDKGTLVQVEFREKDKPREGADGSKK